MQGNCQYEVLRNSIWLSMEKAWTDTAQLSGLSSSAVLCEHFKKGNVCTPQQFRAFWRHATRMAIWCRQQHKLHRSSSAKYSCSILSKSEVPRQTFITVSNIKFAPTTCNIIVVAVIRCPLLFSRVSEFGWSRSWLPPKCTRSCLPRLYSPKRSDGELSGIFIGR